MIGLNKIMKASTLDEYVYFFFCFDDGLYYWLYDKNYELEIRRGGRCDRGKIEMNDYVYIPIEILTKIVMNSIQNLREISVEIKKLQNEFV